MPVIKRTEELESPLRPHSMYEARHSRAVRKSVLGQQRGCKNIGYTILYIFTTLVFIGLTSYVSYAGEFGRVLFPKDSAGTICGIKQDNYDYRSMRYLAFFNYTSPDTTLSRCVSACPNPQTGNILCNYGIVPTAATQPALIANGSCIQQITSEPTFFYCIPIIFNVTANTTQQRELRQLLAVKLQSSSKVSLIFNQLLYAKVLLGM